MRAERRFLCCVAGVAITALAIIFAIAIGHGSKMYHPDYPMWACTGLILLFLLVTPIYSIIEKKNISDIKKLIGLMFGVGLIGIFIQYFLVVEIVSSRYAMYFYWFRGPILLGGLFAFALTTVLLCILYLSRLANKDSAG